MKIIRLSQTTDREAWLELRRGKIGGSTAKKVKPLSRGADRTPAGFWELLAEKLSIAKDGEPERDRGLRLENEALVRTAQQYELDLDLDCGMWVRDDNEDISVSPDSAERGDKPTYAGEAKCLDSKNHLRVIVMDKRALRSENYRAFDSIPPEFQEQIVQYFVVNDDLKAVYFSLYDDRIVIEKLMHHVIVVDRAEVTEEINAQLEMERSVLTEINELVKELTT